MNGTDSTSSAQTSYQLMLIGLPGSDMFSHASPKHELRAMLQTAARHSDSPWRQRSPGNIPAQAGTDTPRAPTVWCRGLLVAAPHLTTSNLSSSSTHSVGASCRRFLREAPRQPGQDSGRSGISLGAVSRNSTCLSWSRELSGVRTGARSLT
jgi:hypothetical protein